MDYRKEFYVKPDSAVDLAKIDTAYTGDADKAAAKARLEVNRQRLLVHQTRLYASGKQAVLICLQGMDGAGKDGTISSIASGVNPMGCETHAFKAPSSEERSHDFLWRIHKAVPPKGKVGLFNRTHYEAVLVERVKTLVPEEVWRKRYDQIREFEQLLTQSGTVVLKFFLHIGKAEQLERFRDRLENPLKQWKISETDYTDRERWTDYQQAYADALSKCSRPNAPWYVIPADRKWFRDLAVSEIICDALDEMKIEDPQPSVDIEAIRKQYHAAVAKG